MNCVVVTHLKLGSICIIYRQSCISHHIHSWEECEHTTNFNVWRSPPVMLPKLGRLRVWAPAPELLRSLIYSRISIIMNIHALAIFRAALCSHIQVRRVCALRQRVSNRFHRRRELRRGLHPGFLGYLVGNLLPAW